MFMPKTMLCCLVAAILVKWPSPTSAKELYQEQKTPNKSISVSFFGWIFSISRVDKKHKTIPKNCNGMEASTNIAGRITTGPGYDMDARVALVNRKYDNCMDLYYANNTNLNKVVTYRCEGKVDYQNVWIKDVGCGFVSIVFTPNLCVGSGNAPGTTAILVKGDDQCDIDLSHRFAVSTTADNYHVFKLVENGLCLTDKDKAPEVIIDHCVEDDPRQQWMINKP